MVRDVDPFAWVAMVVIGLAAPQLGAFFVGIAAVVIVALWFRKDEEDPE